MQMFFKGAATLCLGIAVLVLASESQAQLVRCTQLSPGQKKAVDGETLHSGNTHKYNLTRKDDKNYVVGMNIQFTAQSSNRGTAGSVMHMAGAYQNCFSELRKHGYLPIRSAAGNIDVEIDSTAPAARVNVVNGYKGKVNNRSEWLMGIPCHRMLHEMLHWMGLCDEYKSSEYSCRKMIDKGNIMGSSNCKGLREDQFNQITQPGCSVNNNYVQCARSAYSCASAPVGGCPQQPNPVCGAAPFYDTTSYVAKGDQVGQGAFGNFINPQGLTALFPLLWSLSSSGTQVYDQESLAKLEDTTPKPGVTQAEPSTSAVKAYSEANPPRGPGYSPVPATNEFAPEPKNDKTLDEQNAPEEKTPKAKDTKKTAPKKKAGGKSR